MKVLIVRDDVLQQVKPGGSYEVQAYFVIDNGRVFKLLQKVSRGFGVWMRQTGDLIEAYALHDTATAAEGTLREWKRIAEQENKAEGR